MGVSKKVVEKISTTRAKIKEKRIEVVDEIVDLHWFIRNACADALDKAQGNETLDELEKKGIKAGIKAGLVYFTGSCPLTDEQLEKIADAMVEQGINKINPAISKQLRKRGNL